MTTYTTYRLHFTSPLHIGNFKPDSYDQSESFIRSDTIIAAVISSWAKMSKNEYIGDGKVSFTISSCFPFYGKIGEKCIYFFPRIKMPLKIGDKDSRLSKKIKKVTWLDQHFFEKQLSNSQITENLESCLHGEYLTENELPKDNFMYKQVSERVTIPRERDEKNQPIPFYMERIYFNDSGLFFLATGEGLDKLEEALNFLQYEGLGTDRSVGNGFFTWTKDELTLNTFTSNYSTNLGLYCPTVLETLNSEIDDQSSFELIKRGGWITTEGYQSIEKNSIYMFTEGSVFKRVSGVGGKDGIDLTPDEYPIDHKIYRSGKTIFLPIEVYRP